MAHRTWRRPSAYDSDTIILYRRAERGFFVYGFAKSDHDNIAPCANPKKRTGPGNPRACRFETGGEGGIKTLIAKMPLFSIS
ncbi:type II toxin-antitoxin system RelE/ParE family toxin [Castellaniella defragrans]|uniref:type II toxin-antitoxin system RelE/ParE family toxin n=1 Tax=Castellaniella defragrans TaxID=75697 RepID=UPI0030B85493